jgi:hypothetical protein
MRSYYTPKEAADILGYESTISVYRLIKDKLLVARQNRSRARIQIYPKDIESFQRKHTLNRHIEQ